jgi:biotin carboxylase
MAEKVAPLRGISDLRGYFRTNRTPIYFISPTAFNLLGIDRWVRRFHYINYFDSFEGSHPCVFVPAKREHEEFESIEDVCNYLLAHPQLREFVESRAPHGEGRARGKAVFVFFDEESERRAAHVGLEVALPSAELRHRLDSKIVTTRLGDEAGVPSVPNVLGRASSYSELLSLAASAGLGSDLVVQTPYGDSGKTTFFVRGERDWNVDAEEMTGQELKVMRRIEPRAVAVEACITRHGTVIGPVMTDLTGYPELTPYRGGWCGNDIYPGALSPENRARALELTRRLGDRLAQEGYRGLLEVDYLVDAGSDELYLGELNPRLSGISSMTNVSASAYADMPLFLFHLAEYLDVEYELDVEELNRRWGSDRLSDIWSQIILKEPDDAVELLTEAPRTGVWRLDPRGEMVLVRSDVDWHTLTEESDGFYLRILGPGDYRYQGADLGILVTRTQLQTDERELTDRARQWIAAIRARFSGIPIEPQDEPPHDAFAFKAG